MKRLSVALIIAIALPVQAQESAAGVRDFTLEDLMQIEVTSVSKKPQKLANVAAAVYVISAEDIRVSSANSLPEVLRLATGMDATRIAGNRWAVSIRGFASGLANKMLVLVDGRNAYMPSFSGVVWEDFQVPLEDIERIEVIRGPTAAIWGSNGVNGAINVITKSAAATQIGEVILGSGNVEGAYGRARLGGQNADGSVLYRVYGASQNANSQKALTGGDGLDSYRSESLGFRVDAYLSGGARWDVSGDGRSVHSDVVNTFSMPNLPLTNLAHDKNEGYTLRARYTHPMADGGSLQVQAAYAHNDYDMGVIFAEVRDTLDVDLQHRFSLSDRHDIVWGGGYRHSTDNMPPSQLIAMNEATRRTGSFGLFAQDEIILAQDWRLTVGLRMDHNEFTGWEDQPDARLAWNLTPNQTLWGSFSQAKRAPSRGEHGVTTNSLDGSPGLGVPKVIYMHSDGNLSEHLTAVQIGLRSQWESALSTDAVLFTHNYDRLGVTNISAARVEPHMVGPLLEYLNIYAPYMNIGEVTLNGAEISVDWRPARNWYLRLAQTLQDVAQANEAAAELVAILPSQITSLHVSWTPQSNMDISLWLRHTGARPGHMDPYFSPRNAFSGLDLTLSWRPQKNMELSMIGQNLNDGACEAYTGVIGPEVLPKMLPTCAPRSLSGKMRLTF
jgi:iron complex outermembrane receptor protein